MLLPMDQRQPLRFPTLFFYLRSFAMRWTAIPMPTPQKTNNSQMGRLLHRGARFRAARRCLAAISKSLAQSNKSGDRVRATKRRHPH